MLNETLEKIASDRGFEFRIGAEHWQNLIDGPDDSDKSFADKKKYLMFFNEREESNMTDLGIGIESERITGTFFFAVRSRLYDPDFKHKYDNHIKPLKALALTIRDEDFGCLSDYRLRQYVLESWRENYLDTNLDCVEVRIELVNKV